MKFIDYKCPNCGGSIKYEKGASFGICENCGAELTVQTEVTDKLFRAFDLISVRRFVGAASILNDALLLDAKNGQLYLGLLMCDTECATPMELATTKYNYINNPNYRRALEFLSNEQRKELESLCNSNQAFLTQEHKYPTDRMVELSKIVNVVYSRGYTLLQLYSRFDFSTLNEKDVIDFYQKTSETMEKIISIYESLSPNEKENLRSFDKNEYVEAVQIYDQIKNIVLDLSEEDLNNISKISGAEDNTEYDVEGDVEDDTEDDAEFKVMDLDEEDDEKSQADCANNDWKTECSNIDLQIKKLEYELGGLGLFNPSKKRELKTKIEHLKIKSNNIVINEKIRQLTLKINDNKNKINSLNNTLKKEVDAAKQRFENTPLTAFSRRKSLKFIYKNLDSHYKTELNSLTNSIMNLNKEIIALKKQIINK